MRLNVRVGLDRKRASEAAVSRKGEPRRVHRRKTACVEVRRLRGEKEPRVADLCGVGGLGRGERLLPFAHHSRSRSNIPLEVTEESFPDSCGGISAASVTTTD